MLTGRMVAVRSSNIAAVSYAWFSATLTVAFNNGSIYEYYGVPQSIYAAFLTASSKGTFHHGYIRGRYRYQRIY